MIALASFIRQAVLLAAAALIGYATCHFTARDTIENEIAAESQHKELERLVNRMQASQRAGDAFEKKRRAIDTVFTQLEEEVAHDAPHVVDDCVLPADRLQRWRAANAGAVAGPAAVEPDAGTDAVAAADGRPDEDIGKEPPGGGEAVPPAGGAGL